MMKSKLAILWGYDDLLVEAVEHLLTARRGWQVIRISDEGEAETLTQQVKKVNPEVLIIHEGSFAGDVRLLIKFVQEYPQLKIITISLGDNLMKVYDKQTICIKEVSDLLSIINGNGNPDGKGGETKPRTKIVNRSTPMNVLAKFRKSNRGE